MKSKTWFVYPVLVLLILWVSYWFLAGSGKTRWQDAVNQNKKADEQKAKANLLAAKIKQLQKYDINDLQTRLGSINQVLPAKKELLLFVDHVKLAGALSGVSIGGYSFTQLGDIKEASPSGVLELQRLPINMRVGVTSMGQLKDFITNLENQVPPIRVTSVKFDVGGAEVAAEQYWASKTVTVSDPYQVLPEIDSSWEKFKPWQERLK